ncbi:MAG: hypothetical protein AB1442_07485 [Nitrospirota bacterium]
MNTEKILREAALATPDPERAYRNLEKLFEEAPSLVEERKKQIALIALLFSYSQFLADFSIRNPSALSSGLSYLSIPVSRQSVIGDAEERGAFRDGPAFTRQEGMKLLRDAKKTFLLRITLRDISDVTGQYEIMDELSSLAEALLELALDFSRRLMKDRFGELKEDSFCLAALGKLGAGELNYSSDIDIISLYRSADFSSSGIVSPSNVRMNRITAHEYFCRLTETVTGLLIAPTEDGIAWRTDLRLRPNGQKGELSLSLNSYSSYYEAWGKAWERMMLIRARPVAGDILLGNAFISAIEPFVWKRSIDYNDVEEIRDMKKKIDTVFDVKDIKRGYGGIREIEFFVQTFQLLYGGERHALRTRRLGEAIRVLEREGFLVTVERKTLEDGYLFLRRIEHMLQMKDDLQTHSLPSDPRELRVLARKMGYEDDESFFTALRSMRLKARDMYNSLLGLPDETSEGMVLLKEKLPKDETLSFLSSTGFSQPESAWRNITKLNEQIAVGKTLRERTLLRKTIPLFFEHVTRSANKDRALGALVSFMEKIGSHESYLDLLQKRKDSRKIVITVFSMSSYLTRLLTSLENIESIFEYPGVRMDYPALEERIITALERAHEPSQVIREFKMIEELKAGMLFLSGLSDVYAFSRSLSMLADTILRAAFAHLRLDSFLAVIGFGAFGAEELNIGSDLDIVFAKSVSDAIPRDASSHVHRNPAGAFIKFISGYTAQGFAYRVDLRLRPDGSKGILLNDIAGYRTYYLHSAQPWEIQSLLRARPVCGNPALLNAFRSMGKEVIVKRGIEISGSLMRRMRQRIVNEVAKESLGYDLKNGPGGLKEMEFLVQYLQLKHSVRFPALISHDTVSAVKSLTRYGILEKNKGEFLLRSHRFLRSVDTLLRLNDEDVLKKDSDIIAIIMAYVNIPSRDALHEQIEDVRRKVLAVAENVYVDTDH